jgi:hypothetical protein
MKLSELKDISWHDYDLAENVDPPTSKLDVRELVESTGLAPPQVRAAILLASGASVVSAANGDSWQPPGIWNPIGNLANLAFPTVPASMS